MKFHVEASYRAIVVPNHSDMEIQKAEPHKPQPAAYAASTQW